jgi:membrane protein YdbS with pleckstrin-like domain
LAFPTKLLAPGEEVVSESRPNWSVLAGPILSFVVVLAACVSVVFLWGSAPIVVGYVLAGVALLAACWLAGQIVSWRSRLLVITNRRVVYRWGVLRRTGREIPLERVQDVTFHQTILERIVGAGSLLIESAGKDGQEPFPDIRRPAEKQSLINRLTTGGPAVWPNEDLYQETRRSERRRSQQEPVAPPARALPPRWVPADRDPPTGQLPRVPLGSGSLSPQAEATPIPTPPFSSSGASISPDLRQQLRDLEELHEAGVLTDAEFDRKRRELLGFG